MRNIHAFQAKKIDDLLIKIHIFLGKWVNLTKGRQYIKNNIYTSNNKTHTLQIRYDKTVPSIFLNNHFKSSKNKNKKKTSFPKHVSIFKRNTSHSPSIQHTSHKPGKLRHSLCHNLLIVEGHAHEVLGPRTSGGARNFDGVQPLLYLAALQPLSQHFDELLAVVPTASLVATVLAVL